MSVLWPQKQQLQRTGALQKRHVVQGWFKDRISNTVAGSGHVQAVAFCMQWRPRPLSCARARLRSFGASQSKWLQKQHLQRLGALQERPVAPGAAVAALKGVAEASRGRGSVQGQDQ